MPGKFAMSHPSQPSEMQAGRGGRGKDEAVMVGHCISSCQAEAGAGASSCAGACSALGGRGVGRAICKWLKVHMKVSNFVLRLSLAESVHADGHHRMGGQQGWCCMADEILMLCS